MQDEPPYRSKGTPHQRAAFCACKAGGFSSTDRKAFDALAPDRDRRSGGGQPNIETVASDARQRAANLQDLRPGLELANLGNANAYPLANQGGINLRLECVWPGHQKAKSDHVTDSHMTVGGRLTPGFWLRRLSIVCGRRARCSSTIRSH